MTTLRSMLFFSGIRLCPRVAAHNLLTANLSLEVLPARRPFFCRPPLDTYSSSNGDSYGY